MNGDEKIAIFGIGDGGSLFKRQIAICCSGHNHFTFQRILNLCRQLLADRQSNVFFKNPFHRSGCSEIFTAVPWIDDNAADAQSQLFGQGSGIDFSMLSGGSFGNALFSALALAWLGMGSRSRRRRLLGPDCARFISPYVQNDAKRIVQ